MIFELDREIKILRKMFKRNREIKMHIKFDFPALALKYIKDNTIIWDFDVKKIR